MSELLMVNTSTMNTEMVSNNSINDRHKVILERVANFFNKSVSIRYINGEVREIEDSDHIVVNMWAGLPNTDMELPDKSTAFGHVFCTDGVFVPVGGLQFGEDIPLIQFIEDNFYFLYDMCDNNSEDEFNLMEKLIEGILIQIAGSSEKVEEQILATKKYQDDQRIQAFVKRITAREKEFKASRDRSLRDKKASLDNYRAESRKLMLAIIVEEKLLTSNVNALTDLEEMLIKEIAIISANKRIKSVIIDGEGYMVINTNMIFANVTGKDKVTRRYRFGEYNISIDVSNGSIVWKNLNAKDRHKSAWTDHDQHPHINASGNACLGNASSLIMDCVDRFQWGVLADVLINYLESVNIDDGAGRCYWHWEQVDKEGNKVSPQYNANN